METHRGVNESLAWLCVYLKAGARTAAVEPNLCPVSSKGRQNPGVSLGPEAAQAVLGEGGLMA